MHNFSSPAPIESIQAHTLVIYHANCVDGFASAWTARRFLGEEGVDYKPWSYTDPKPIVSGYSTIYVVDFSFSREILTYLCDKVGDKVVVLDHHKTAEANLTNWKDKPENLELVFDMNRSGAGITWDYFAADSSRPHFIDYVEDRDLWKFKLGNSKAVNAYISTISKTFKDYDVLFYMFLGDMRTHGQTILSYHQKICEEIVQEARKIVINGKEGLACNCTPQFSSEIGNLLAQKSGTYGVTYHTLADDSTKFSLRSVGECDVSKIAKNFGGGGHKNAAGFTMSFPAVDSSSGITIWGLESPKSILFES